MTFGFVLDLGKGFATDGFTVLLVAILAVSWFAAKAKPSFASKAALSLYVISYLLANTWQLVFLYGGTRDLAVQVYQLASFAVLALYAGVAWYLVRRPDKLIPGDIFGQLFWLVLLFAEANQVFEYAVCKMAGDPYTDAELAIRWAERINETACQRVFGSAKIGPLVTTLFLAWPSYRAYQLWRMNPPKE